MLDVKTIVITGATGSGKSQLIGILSNHSNLPIHVIDPLAKDFDPNARLELPSLNVASVIAFDHVTFLPGAKEKIAAAQAWCQRNNQSLLLVDQRKVDLLAYLPTPANLIQFELFGRYEKRTVIVTVPDETKTMTFAEFKKQLEAA